MHPHKYIEVGLKANGRDSMCMNVFACVCVFERMREGENEYDYNTDLDVSELHGHKGWRVSERVRKSTNMVCLCRYHR